MQGKSSQFHPQLKFIITNPPNRTIELKENTVIVVLGASGDLAKKKTFPALFGLVSTSVNLRSLT